LTCNPFRRWICRDVDPDELSAVRQRSRTFVFSRMAQL
jgi:hypothetical protein